MEQGRTVLAEGLLTLPSGSGGEQTFSPLEREGLAWEGRAPVLGPQTGLAPLKGPGAPGQKRTGHIRRTPRVPRDHIWGTNIQMEEDRKGLQTVQHRNYGDPLRGSLSPGQLCVPRSLGSPRARLLECKGPLGICPQGRHSKWLTK